ncbi:MAG TPA: hypothetical protein VFA99_05340 [Acidobacteriaceae bacterium]|nr:hypothetical protein [Acidobacteriaceae bacterium]
MKFLLNALLAASCLPSLNAQSANPPAAQPQLSPKAAYDEAMQPLTTTRAQVSNWSDAEIAALKVTIARAAEACAARHPADVDGDALIDLARLCALGQTWNTVVESTTRYIQSDAPSKPLLADAYAAQIDANLHLKNEPAALTGARAMLASVPYDALAAEAIDEALAYMQFAHTADALSLAALRQPLILAGLKASASPRSSAPATSEASSASSPQPIHALYSDGLMLAALAQLAGKLPAATETVASLDAALPSPLPTDDSLMIATARRRYALLGHPLPALRPLSYLRSHEPLPQLPARNAITALLVFPDWCAQCVRMGEAFPETVFTVAGHEAYLYGALAETVPPAKAPRTDGFEPADSSLLLNGTPTIVLPPAVLDRLAVDAVPFLLLTDAGGTVRVAQSIDPSAIQPGNTVDTAIACVGAHWPLHSAMNRRAAASATKPVVPGPAR